MPRDGGTGVYSKPAGTTAVSGTTIESAKYNSTIDDLVVDANTARPVVVGGTGANTAAGARTNLGLTIGTDVMAYNDELTSIAALGTAADKYLYTTAENTWAEGDITTAGRAILDDADAAAQRATLDASQSPLDEDDFATDSATRPPSQQSVGAYIRELMGFSNVWQDVTASRAVNTSYTNSTGTVIYVGVQSSVTTGNPEQELEISADNGVTWVTAAQGLFDTDSNARRRISPFGPIPVYPGERYRLVAANVELWLERRPPA